MNALILGPSSDLALITLRATAEAYPVDMASLEERLKYTSNKAAHKAHMTRQSVGIPFGYLVTFSIETGHPGGTARHLSMSSHKTPGRVPNEHAVWLVAERLGFTGSLRNCKNWLEELEGHGMAVNVAQLFEPTPVGHA